MEKIDAPAATGRYGDYAGFVSRLLAFFIDLLICTVVFGILTACSRFVTQTLSLGKATTTLIALLTLGAQVVFVGAYFVVFITLAGQTPGKYLLGIRIVSTDGGPVRLGFAFRRVVAYVLSLPLLWGFLIMLIDDCRQDFPDKFASTYVIYSWPVPPTIQLATPIKDRIARRQQRQRAPRQPPAPGA